MRHLGQRLGERGFLVSGPLLPGHGVDLAALDACTWHDWYAGVERAFDELRGRCERVAVVGQSLGGLLALHLAARRGAQVSALAALATPLWLPPLARAAIWATRPQRPLGRALIGAIDTLPKLGGSDLRDPEMKRRNPCYPAIPVRALHQLVAFMHLVRGELGEGRVPALVMHGRRDHTAPFACSRALAAELGAPRVEHRTLEHGFHRIASDVERERVADEVGAFLRGAAEQAPP